MAVPLRNHCILTAVDKVQVPGNIIMSRDVTTRVWQADRAINV